MKCRKYVIAIDFDGTIVENQYPEIGKIKKDCINFINKLSSELNCEIIIWTCRENEKLKEAIDFLNKNNITYHYVNDNCNWAKNEFSHNAKCRKIFADLYIDDRAIFSDINWSRIYQEIKNKKEKENFYNFI